MRSRKPLRTATLNKDGVSNFDRWIYGKVKQYYLVNDHNLHRAFPKLAPGVVKGALSRLKKAKWLVFVPSLNGHMTASCYKGMITDDGLSDPDIDA